MSNEAERMVADALRERAEQEAQRRPTVPREVADRLAKSLEMCAANDKTEYDYRGKARLNRNGAAPDQPGERFKTPREIAAEALAEYRKAVARGE